MAKFVTVYDSMAGFIAINMDHILFAEPCEIVDGCDVIGRGIRLNMACPTSVRHPSGVSPRDPHWDPRDEARVGPYPLDVHDDAVGYGALLEALGLST